MTLLNLNNRHAHFVGLAGSGMRALATVLMQRGWTISGSDLQPSAARKLAVRGAKVFSSHAGDNVPTGTTVLIYSEAIPADNLERKRAEQLGIPIRSYAQMLGEICKSPALAQAGAASTGEPRKTLAVAGTHGKSTVTAMAAEILICAGLDPTVICGAAAITPSRGGIGATGGRNGDGQINLVEACEYRDNFLHLQPDVAVLLNIEPDHFDYFRTNEQLTAAFTKFAASVPEDGLIIAGHESNAAQAIAYETGRQMTTFGLAGDADWKATKLEHSRGRYRFDLVRHGRRLTTITLAVPGRHNVLNALAAATLARHCGASVQQIAQGLAAFSGLKRRLEIRGRFAGVPWVDDYAHHPTEVKAALAAVRQMFPRRNIYCVFQPHQASRLTILLDELAASLHNVDKLAVAKVFRAREGAPRPGEATAVDLAATVRAGGAVHPGNTVHPSDTVVLDEHSPTAIARHLMNELKPGDVLVTLGAGDLGKIFHEFRERLRRDRAVA